MEQERLTFSQLLEDDELSAEDSHLAFSVTRQRSQQASTAADLHSNFQIRERKVSETLEEDRLNLIRHLVHRKQIKLALKELPSAQAEQLMTCDRTLEKVLQTRREANREFEEAYENLTKERMLKLKTGAAVSGGVLGSFFGLMIRSVMGALGGWVLVRKAERTVIRRIKQNIRRMSSSD